MPNNAFHSNVLAFGLAMVEDRRWAAYGYGGHVSRRPLRYASLPLPRGGASALFGRVEDAEGPSAPRPEGHWSALSRRQTHDVANI